MSKHNGDHEARDLPAEQLTAYALGQLHGEELAAVKAKLSAAGNEAALVEVREIQAAAAGLSAARHAEPVPGTSAGLRELLEQRLLETAPREVPEPSVTLPESRRTWRTVAIPAAILGTLCCVLLVAIAWPLFQSSREARIAQAQHELRQRTVQAVQGAIPGKPVEQSGTDHEIARFELGYTPPIHAPLSSPPVEYESQLTNELQFRKSTRAAQTDNAIAANPVPQGDLPVFDPAVRPPTLEEQLAQRPPVLGSNVAPPGSLASNYQGARAGGGYGGGMSGDGGGYGGGMLAGGDGYGISGAYGGVTGDGYYGGGRRPAKKKAGIHPEGGMAGTPSPETSVAGFPIVTAEAEVELARRGESRSRAEDSGELRKYRIHPADGLSKGEQYAPIFENAFLSPLTQPLSTFSIDVDTAAYANVRRFLTSGRLPPPDSVRIEELVNYFRYEYPQPKSEQPFSVNMEVAECPWRAGHWLLKVGLKGREVARDKRPASNLVFLLDVSGSMSDANKLPLLKTAMQMLTRELGENDRVAIVTYAGEAGLKLASTRGHEQGKILGAIESLNAGGSTNGSAGIELAYEQAAKHFIKEGTNRVILCTDGDLNVGVTSNEALVELIKQKAKSGTFLTVLGFGEGNLKDAKLEQLADNGNGLYAYIDSVREARKVLVEQLTGSTVTIAKDVKIQIEFNPREIASYRLLGYENRVLAAEDFNNDKKDAGEIGAGHTVTALYELVPVGATKVEALPQPVTDPLRYQQPGANLLPENRRPRPDSSAPGPGLAPAHDATALTDAAATGELLTLKLRYKEPDGGTSKLLEYPLKDRGKTFGAASQDLQFAAAVASFGMVLRGSQHRGAGTLAAVEEMAGAALGGDAGGYRAEFVDLVRKAQSLGAK